MNKTKAFSINNRYFIIAGIAIIVVITLSVKLLNTTFSISDNISVVELKNIIENKDDRIIYILNSDSSNSYNYNILSYLDENDINYSIYDISKVEESEYIELLNILDINTELFDSPAIIYIKDGIMFANIININDLNVVDKFIKDYDLKVLKEVHYEEN